jgi:integrase
LSAGACGYESTPLQSTPVLFQLKEYAETLRLNGRTQSTIKTVTTRLKLLSKHCKDVNNPYEVKDTLAKLKWQNSTKATTVTDYTGYLKFLGKKWEPPTYKRTHKLPFIPTEQELDLLIAEGRNKTATLLQTLKETGARIGELIDFLKWEHIDTQRKTIYITPEKGSNARYIPISDKLLNMLNTLPHKNNKVFNITTKGARMTFTQLRKRLSKKLSNPRLLKIHLHTFRHWKATTEYHKTKDIMHVASILGHKDIRSTQNYIVIENALYSNTFDDEWTHKVCHSLEEEGKLINAGFELVRAVNETTTIYRKRK